MRTQLKERILRLVEPSLGKFAFAYDGKPDTLSWQFKRRMDGVDHFVTFEKSFTADNSLRVTLSTSQDQMGLALDQVAEIIRPTGIAGWWTYHDSASLDAVLIELVHLTVKFGIPWLENSGGPLLWPPERHGQELLVDPQGRAKGLAIRLGLSLEDEDSLAAIERQLLKRHAEVQGNPDWDLLLECAAFVGELIRRQFGGEWGWDANLKTGAILGIGGKPSLVAAPLRMVTAFWSKRDRLRRLSAGPPYLRTVLSPPGGISERH